MSNTDKWFITHFQLLVRSGEMLFEVATLNSGYYFK